MTFLDDEETPADPKPAATTEMSNEDMIAMALTALAPALLGGAMGGKQGALAGGAAGAKGAASVFQYQADEESEAKKLAKAMAAKEGSRQQNLTDQRGLIDYKDELDRGKPKTEKVGGTLLSMSADGKSATPLYTEPTKPDAPKDDSGHIKDKVFTARTKYVQDSRPYITAIKNASEAKTLATLSKTNPRAAGALVGKLARSAGEVGVLSDADISRLGGSQALDERIKRFVGLSTSDQKITDEDIRYAEDLASVMESKASESLVGLEDEAVTSFHAIYGGNPDEVRTQITGRKAGSKTAPPPAAEPDSVKSAKAWLKANPKSSEASAVRQGIIDMGFKVDG